MPAGGPLAEARLLSADLRRRLPGRVQVPLRSRATSSWRLARRATAGSRRREGYRLEVGPVLRIEARTAAGAFYGTRSVVRALRRKPSIPAGTARDWPCYPERGLMLDNGRRYFRPGWLRGPDPRARLAQAEPAAPPFSDDQGFRIASSSHPEIVSDPHLTKRQVRRLVAYARARHIRVIPEIDMPGHMRAALAAHRGLQLAEPGGDPRLHAARRDAAGRTKVRARADPRVPDSSRAATGTAAPTSTCCRTTTGATRSWSAMPAPATAAI